VVNPSYEVLDDTQLLDFEGCLSVPGMRGKVRRARKIRYAGLSEHGTPIDVVAEGWHARLFQHEFDHLNGILYPTLLAEEDALMTLEEYNAAMKRS
jgi:peptide deformylase